jgi:hypothetical protein
VRRPSDQLRDQGGQERKFYPTGTTWVQGGAGLGWVWSGGSNLAPGPLGSVAGHPVTPTGTGAGSSAPPPYRRLPAGG